MLEWVFRDDPTNLQETKKSVIQNLDHNFWQFG